MTLYPNSIDNNTSLPPATGDDAVSVNAAIGAIEAIETELGILPSGPYATVRTRMDILESRINNPFPPSPGTIPPIVANPFFIGPVFGVSIQTNVGDPNTINALAVPGSLYLDADGYVNDTLFTFGSDGYWHSVTSTPSGTAGGDLGGNYPNPTVVGLQGHAVRNIAPTDGYVLTYNAPAMRWEPQAITSGSVTLSGDVTGNATSNHVVKINGTSVPPTPTTDQVLVATGGTSAVWQSLVNAQISNSAAIAYSKLNLTGNIVNSDISASAVIAVNKLASGTSAQILLNNSTPTPTWTSVSQDIAISNTGVVDVTGLLTHALPALSDGYLNWTGSAWALSTLPSSLPPSGAAGGDLTGTYPNPKVISLSGTTGSVQAVIASNLIQFPNPGTVLTGTVSVSGVPSGNITDVVTINNGSPSVNATNSGGNFAVLIPGQIIQFSSQPSVNYTILSITNNNTFTLTTNYTGTNSTTASIITFPNIVYGSGTLFTTQVAVGQAVVIGNDPGTSYIVASIQSNTQLTLTNQYANPSATGQTITAVMNITQNAATSDISPSPIVITGQNAFSGASTFTKGGNIALIPGAPTSGTSNGGSVVVYLSPILNGGAPVASPHSGSDGSFIVTNSTLLNPYASTASFSVNPYSNQACRVYIGGSGESYLDSNGSSLFISGMPTRVGNGSDLDMDFCALSVNTTLDNQNIMARTSVQFQSQISNPVISLNAPAQDALINHPLTITGQNAYVNTSFTPTGTVFINNGSMTLNGFNTFFQIQLFAGQTITISAVNYVIGSITTETQLILTTPYAGTTILSPGVSFTATTFNTTGGDVNITSGAKTPSAITGTAGNVNIQTGGTTKLSVTPSLVNLDVNTLQFAAAETSPTILQVTPTSDVAAQNLTISSQAPYPLASINNNSGSIIFDIPAPVHGGTYGNISVQNDGYDILQIVSNSSDGYLANIIILDTDHVTSASAGYLRLPWGQSLTSQRLIEQRNINDTADLDIISRYSSELYFGSYSEDSRYHAANQVLFELASGGGAGWNFSTAAGPIFNLGTDGYATISFGGAAIGNPHSGTYWQKYSGATASSSSDQTINSLPIFLNDNTVTKLKCTVDGYDLVDGYFCSFTLTSTFGRFGGVITSSVVAGGVVSDQDYSAGAADVSPAFVVTSNLLNITVTPFTSNRIFWTISVNGFQNTGTS